MTYKNYIDGQWCEGQATLANHSPSDTRDLIGEYHRPAPNRPARRSRLPAPHNPCGPPRALRPASRC